MLGVAEPVGDALTLLEEHGLLRVRGGSADQSHLPALLLIFLKHAQVHCSRESHLAR